MEPILTNELLQKFVGGQVDISNAQENYSYKGEIKTIELKNDQIKITFEWLAREEGSRWIRSKGSFIEIDIGLHSFVQADPEYLSSLSPTRQWISFSTPEGSDEFFHHLIEDPEE